MTRAISLIILLLFISSLCSGQTRPEPKKETVPAQPLGWVSDFAHVFTPGQVSYLDSLIGLHEKTSSNEVAVVTLQPDSSLASPEAFEKACLQLFNKWGIGKKGKNNGVGIFFSPGLKYIRIETGSGLVSELTNAEAKHILDAVMIPEFKKSAFFEGVVKGLEAIFREID